MSSNHLKMYSPENVLGLWNPLDGSIHLIKHSPCPKFKVFPQGQHCWVSVIIFMYYVLHNIHNTVLQYYLTKIPTLSNRIGSEVTSLWIKAQITNQSEYGKIVSLPKLAFISQTFPDNTHGSIPIQCLLKPKFPEVTF